MRNSKLSVVQRNASGQPMGRKGQETRQRLVDATVELLKEHSLTSLRAADIAALAGTSKPNFYLYFPTVVDAVLAAVEAASMHPGELTELLEQPWPDEQVFDCTTRLVKNYFRHWSEHAHVLRVRRAMFIAGDRRFYDAEVAAALPILTRLAAKIEAAQRKHPTLRRVHPASAAAAAFATVERLASTVPLESNEFGISDETLVSAIATMIANLLVPPASIAE